MQPSGSRLPASITNSCRAITPWRSEQRRHLSDFHRSEQHRAVGEAQWEGARLLAFERGFAADGLERDGDADIGVLLDDLAEARNGLVERAEEIVEVLRLDPGRDAVERAFPGTAWGSAIGALVSWEPRSSRLLRTFSYDG